SDRPGVMISSPGSGSTAAIAAWIAAVPELDALARREPMYWGNSRSSTTVCPPTVEFSRPLRITSAAARTSSSPRVRPEASETPGSGSVRIGVPPWRASAVVIEVLTSLFEVMSLTLSTVKDYVDTLVHINGWPKLGDIDVDPCP